MRWRVCSVRNARGSGLAAGARRAVALDPAEYGVASGQGARRSCACLERKDSGNQQFHPSAPTHATCVEMDPDGACEDDRGLRYADIVTGLTSPNASRRVRVSGRSPGLRVDVESSRQTAPSRADGTVALDGLWLAYRCVGSAGLASPERILTGFPFQSRETDFLNHLRREAEYADESGCARFLPRPAICGDLARPLQEWAHGVEFWR